MKQLICFSFLVVSMNTSNSLAFGANEKDRPNVIIVITDDQGYGDLGGHGNPMVKTPALNDFYRKSVRLINFHVAPTCAPTRAALMTGRYANRTGVWHTVGGVSILREDEVTLADVFQRNGYETAMVGKWHLGDSYPSRPQDKGFKHVVAHGGGGVGQTPDYWGNDYFDDTYFVNGEPTEFEGYCTDVWFDKAIKYIQKKKNSPFFMYISTNAPHSPFNVPIEYYNLYKNKDIPETQKRFYGMISNVDDNFRRLREELDRLELVENTIIIFMTDNGTAAGYRMVDDKLYGYNAGMRGTKGSEYDGGHRVPFFISYPKGNIRGGKDVDNLTANIDILPTLSDLCGLNVQDLKIDGTNIAPLLKGETSVINRDYIITDSQRLQTPVKWRKSAVMTDKYRLINGRELYNVEVDPGQKLDISELFPEKVRTLRNYYEDWWNSVSEEFSEYTIIKVGSELQNPVDFTVHDAHMEVEHLPWNQNQIRLGEKNPYGGFYTLDWSQKWDLNLAI